MFGKKIAMSFLAAAVAMPQATPVMADGGDALVGGIIGGLIGGAIMNENNKQRRTVRSAPRTTVSSAQREANREAQVALNYFGYPVGTPDGALGQRSRAAISDYQATLGYTPTGQLTEYERTLLVGSYQRAIAGGALTLQQAAANPMGMRGLLVAWRDEAQGKPQTQTAMAAQPEAPAATDVAAAPDPAPAPDAPVAAAAPALPNFMAGSATDVSLESECNKINLVTSTNGGFTTVASMSDPMQALGEQFCLARSYAIAQGEDLAAKVPGLTKQQIADQCAGFGPAMKDEILALSQKSAADVTLAVQKFAASTGMSSTQLEATAKICLSVGYTTDNMPVAIASALILTGVGDGAYGELVGHHLSQGFGVVPRPDLALDWYATGLAAAQAPGSAVFAPGQPERLDVIRKASLIAGGKADEAAAQEPVPAALPSFQVPQDATETAAPAQAAAIAPAASGETAVAVSASTSAPAAGQGSMVQSLLTPFAILKPMIAGGN